MSEGAAHRATDEIEEKERRGGGPSSRDVAGSLGSTEMTLRLWRFPPGDAMALHRHRSQEEIYHLISGGPQNVEVDGAPVAMNDGDWLRVSKDTPRRIVNDTDREGRWMIVGAPPGTGITDGVRLDPETGEEIPRT
jgi:quercetin dioxygenase-like cupin family protein